MPRSTTTEPRASPLSILTRSEERMLFSPINHPGRGASAFNPHPLRRADAISAAADIVAYLHDFQSSPAPKSGCYDDSDPDHTGRAILSILTRSEERMLFDAANTRIAELEHFQSSPAPKSGCYVEEILHCTPCIVLSILTRSEERMLYFSINLFTFIIKLSILTRSEERMLLESYLTETLSILACPSMESKRMGEGGVILNKPR